MKPLFLLLLLGIAFVAAQRAAPLASVTSLKESTTPAPPQKPVWPIQFDVKFGLFNRIAVPSIINETSHLFYDFAIEKQVIHYPERCVAFIAPNAENFECKLFFEPSGIYLWQPQNNIPCCQAVAGVGTVPPEFLRGFEFSNQDTAKDFFGNELLTDHWVGPDGFQYWTERVSGIDVVFNEGFDSDVFWHFAPFNIVDQDPIIFNLPESQEICNQPCPTFADGVPAAQRRIDDPMVALALLLARQQQQQQPPVLVEQ